VQHLPGEGVRTTRTLTVGVPAGVDDGAQLRLSGEADSGLYGGPAGNLFVQLRVKPDPVFKRNENDLHVEVPINIAQAALGVEFEAPTLEGTTTLRIPEGTQSGRTIRLRERGVPFIRGMGRGDLIYTVVVQTPTNLTAEQRGLLDQLAQTFVGPDGKSHPALGEKGEKGFFDKLKDTLLGE
jgi:molecular chaperone DnaJ